jgi:hypothetical protein
MIIHLQSFYSELKGYPYSVARYQPKNFSYNELHMFKPYNRDGSVLNTKHPSLFLEGYCLILKREFLNIERWTLSINNMREDISLLCWCDEKKFNCEGKLLCHTIMIGYLIERISRFYNLDIKVEYHNGREFPIWSRLDFANQMKL